MSRGQKGHGASVSSNAETSPTRLMHANMPTGSPATVRISATASLTSKSGPRSVAKCARALAPKTGCLRVSYQGLEVEIAVETRFHDALDAGGVDNGQIGMESSFLEYTITIATSDLTRSRTLSATATIALSICDCGATRSPRRIAQQPVPCRSFAPRRPGRR